MESERHNGVAERVPEGSSKKEESETSRLGYASSSNSLPLFSHYSSKKENLTDNLSDKLSDELSDQKMVGLSPEGLDRWRAFEKNLEGLENLVKLFKSDVSKMFDISSSSLIELQKDQNTYYRK